MNHPVHHITDAKLHGMYSMRKQIDLQICFWNAESQKGDKVGILLMNCLEWLPIYFGILKTGALAVPLNFRYSADEIKYCVELADVDILVFGPEFIGRVEEIADDIGRGRLLYFVGDGCPGFAEDYTSHTANCSSQSPKIDIVDEDDAAIYFFFWNNRISKSNFT